MSDTSASIARGRLQTIFARERDLIPASDALDSSHTKIPSTKSEHASVSPDKPEAALPASVDIPVLASEVETQIAAPEAQGTEAPPRSLQLSTGEDAAKAANQTTVTPASNASAGALQLSSLSAAAAIIAAAGLAWWVNGQNDANRRSSERPTSTQAETSLARPMEFVETRTREIRINSSEDVPPAAPQTTSSTSRAEPATQGEQAKITAINDEMAIRDSSMEAKLAGFFEQASEKSVEFDLDRISFDPGSSILRPSSSEQLQNVARILMAHPKSKISVSAYVGPSTNGASGLKLSRARVNSVVRELSRTGYKSPIAAQIYKRMPIRKPSNSGEAKGQEQQRISLTVTKI